MSFAEPCDYFTVGKAKASTLSLSVIVAIEMFNALNALSEVGRARGAGGGVGSLASGAGADGKREEPGGEGQQGIGSLWCTAADGHQG